MISDEQLENFTSLFHKIMDEGGVKRPDLLWPILQELKERRESDLRPAAKFLNLKIGEQLRIVEGELDEVFNALPAYLIEKDDGVTGITESLMHFAEEIVDTQTALETLLVIAGLDETARNEVRRRVIEKNAKRGYYEGEKK